MMLIHPRVFDSMRHMIPKPTIAQRSMSELEDRMQEILANKMISDEEKVKLYSDALARYSTIERNMRSKSQIETSYRNDSADGTIASVAAYQPDIKEEILQEVPERYHDEAGQLIDIVRKGLPDVTWTTSGRMLYKNKSIPNSNLVTLISFLSDDGKANDQPPPGHRELAEALNAARVAPSLVTRKEDDSVRHHRHQRQHRHHRYPVRDEPQHLQHRYLDREKRQKLANDPKENQRYHPDSIQLQDRPGKVFVKVEHQCLSYLRHIFRTDGCSTKRRR